MSRTGYAIAITSKTLSSQESFVEWLRENFADVRLNQSDRLRDQGLIDFLKGMDYMVLGTEPFHKDIIAGIPHMRAVFKYGVGIDNIDFFACGNHNLPVYHKKGTNSDAVAEIALSYAVLLLRNQHVSGSCAKRGEWNKMKGKELAESTIGVVGYGHVGSAVLRKLETLKTGRLLVNDKEPEICCTGHMRGAMEAKFVPLQELMEQSDVVSIHIDNEYRTNCNFFNDERLSWLQDGAYIINTSRGSIMDYDALEAHLPRLGGVALDVFPAEPDIPEFLKVSDKAMLACHICGSSHQALKNGEEFIKNSIVKHVDGTSLH